MKTLCNTEAELKEKALLINNMHNQKNVCCFNARSVTHSIWDSNNNYGTVDIVEKRLILSRYFLSRGAVLGGLLCTLISTHLAFWYCKYNIRLFIERCHVQILYKNQCYNCLEIWILHQLNIFNSDNKQSVSAYIGRLPIVNI